MPQTSNGLRLIRSMYIPYSGANSAGIIIQKKVRPAAPLEPVRVLTHMLSTSSITESPSMLAVKPVKSRVKPFC